MMTVRTLRRGRVPVVATAAAALSLLLSPIWAGSPARAQDVTPPEGVTTSDKVLQNVGIDQKMGAQVPADLTFKDETGKTVRLGDYFGKKPVILTLVYYQCPMLCTLTLNGLVQGVKGLAFDTGKDYEVVAVSFNPQETPALADAKKRAYMEAYGRPGTEKGWHFLTGDKASIDALATTVGFKYMWDARQKQYAHTAGLMILTPGGKVARYFYGIEYLPKFLRLALVEASEGKIGTPVDRVLLLCYHYDPVTGTYGVRINRVLQAAGLVTVLVLGSFMLVMFRRDRRHTEDPPLTGVSAPDTMDEARGGAGTLRDS